MLTRSLVQLLTVVLLVFGSGVAHAVTLGTPHVHIVGDQRIRVYVTNLGTKPIDDLAVTLTNTSGAVTTPDADLCEEGGPLLPLNTCFVLYDSSGFATVTGKGKLRAAINVVGNSGLVEIIPASK